MAPVVCKRCGRRLTNPKSIERGYGPVCAKKLGIAVKSSKSLLYILRRLYDGKQPTLEEYFSDNRNQS